MFYLIIHRFLPAFGRRQPLSIELNAFKKQIIPEMIYK